MNALPWSRRSAGVRRALPAMLGALATAAAVTAALWLAERPLVRGHGPHYQRGPGDGEASALAAPPLVAAAGNGTAGTLPLPAGDSTNTSAFSVRMGRANTPAGAILRLQQLGASVPARTFAPASDHDTPVYDVYAGAFTTSHDAEAFLKDLRAHGQLNDTGGAVVRLPLALLIKQDVTADSVAARVATLSARGLPAYALRQPDGRARVYVGAFAAPDSALATMITMLRAAGITPTLAYRMGRTF